MKMNRIHVNGRIAPAQLTHSSVDIQRIRAFIVILFLLMLKVDVGWGQCGKNIIQNPNFLLGPPCTLPGNNASSSFLDGCVANWFRATVTPHHAMANPNSLSDRLCDIANIPWQPYNGSEFTCLGNHEGIFQNVSILQNPNLAFEFSIDIAGLQCETTSPGNTMEILVTKDLTNNTPFFTTINLPRQSLLVHNITNTTPTTLTVPFTVQANSGFNQIWMRNRWPDNQPGMFTFKNAILTCTTNTLADITTSILGNQVTFGTTNNDNTCPFESYNWNFGDPASGAQNNTSALPVPVHIFSAQGTYNVCVEVIDCNGCCATRCEEVVVECDNTVPSITITDNCPNFT